MKLKKILPVMMLISSAFAATSYEQNSGNSITVDMVSYCSSRIKGNECIYNGDVQVSVSCLSGRLAIDGGTLSCSTSSGDMLITSNIPISGIVAGSSYKKVRSGAYTPIDAADSYLSTDDGADNYSIKIEGNGTDEAEIYKVKVITGNPNYLSSSLKSSSGVLKLAYKGVLRNLENFEKQIAKSHRGHLSRFEAALKDGVSLMEAKDKQGQAINSLVHWKIQENARIVVAFGSILDELLTDYDDVQSLKLSITSMRTLVGELKEAYGWGRSLSGKVSKASSTLLDVVRLELQELGAIRMSLGDSVASYTKLLKITGSLKAKVDAAKSGDMRAQREIYSFVDAWNESAWQAELDKLVHAGPDVKNLVTPKLTMLLQAMESLEDLSEAGFEVPKL